MCGAAGREPVLLGAGVDGAEGENRMIHFKCILRSRCIEAIVAMGV